MNLVDNKYSKYNLVREMFEAIDVIKNFDPDECQKFIEILKNKEQVFLTGEGSSRIFPAKREVYHSRKRINTKVFTEASLTGLEYDLSNSVIFAASYSGKTNEVMTLFNYLMNNNHNAFFCLSAFQNSPLFQKSMGGYQLKCGEEKAVAATKSVIEHALFYHIMFLKHDGFELFDLEKASNDFKLVLNMEINHALIEKFAKSNTIYYAGKNNGVAEELTLKTNEITRKKSAYLEATYLLHGIEEVLIPGEDIILIIDPYEQEEQKIYDIIYKRLGIEVIAIADRKTLFPTIITPENKLFSEYLQLAAGWNMLVETAITKRIDMDVTEKARKVGNMVEI